MLSNKLTFSLVFVLVFTLVAGSAMAQTVNVPNDLDGDTDEDQQLQKGQFLVIAQSAGGTTKTGASTDYGTQNGIGLLNPAVAVGANFPNVADYLLQSGTIELAINSGDDDTFTVAADADEAAVTALALNHKIVISEIMWGLNRSASGSDPDIENAAQWVEIYNHDLGLKAGDRLALIFGVGRPIREVGKKYDAPAGLTDMWVILDQVSTQGRFGSWTVKGSSGNTETIREDTTDPNAIPPTNLVSMYRNITLKDAAYETVADGVDKGKLKGLGDGNEDASWAESVGSVNMRGYYVGSPGSVHVTPAGTAVSFAANPASFTTDAGIIINEVRNDTSEANLDWIELYHYNDGEEVAALSLEKYEITRAMKNEKDELVDAIIVTGFPKYKLQRDTYLVIYNRHPGDTILAGGVNIQDVVDGAQVDKGASHVYFVDENLDLPSTGKFLLILRSDKGKNKKPDNAVDYVGNGFYEKIDATTNTDVWPFQGWAKPAAGNFTDDSFADANHSWARNTALNEMGDHRPKSNAARNEEWAKVGEMGGVGYDRKVDLKSAPGTPGYANVVVNVISTDQDTVKGEDDYDFAGAITISEIMYDARHPRDLVQWIELYNNSSDITIDIGGWEMEIRNIADGKVESYVDSGFEFKDDTQILPNQTLLLVSRTGPSSVPSTRVYDLNREHRTELGLQRRDKVLLSSEGFYIELKAKVSADGKDEMVDMDSAGNLMVDGATRTKQWDLPAADSDGARYSIVRQYDAGVETDGSMADSWKAAKFAGLAYYGHRDDVGTPGYRRGGPLPVSLSSFRPVRDKATGEVVIRWITQSELNNAGFNILRSDSKDGEFKVINLQGIIAGHGTTSEKHVYTFTDKTAKPNVVYYYQIEDVSLNGKRTTLATTHMRGNVNVAGKVTTTWSDLKLQK